jgi:hypothetical protein
MRTSRIPRGDRFAFPWRAIDCRAALAAVANGDAELVPLKPAVYRWFLSPPYSA